MLSHVGEGVEELANEAGACGKAHENGRKTQQNTGFSCLLRGPRGAAPHHSARDRDAFPGSLHCEAHLRQAMTSHAPSSQAARSRPLSVCVGRFPLNRPSRQPKVKQHYTPGPIWAPLSQRVCLKSHWTYGRIMKSDMASGDQASQILGTCPPKRKTTGASLRENSMPKRWPRGS